MSGLASDIDRRALMVRKVPQADVELARRGSRNGRSLAMFAAIRPPPVSLTKKSFERSLGSTLSFPGDRAWRSTHGCKSNIRPRRRGWDHCYGSCAILAVSAMPLHAQQPSTVQLNADAQNLFKIISSDKRKILTVTRNTAQCCGRVRSCGRIGGQRETASHRRP
jgi:hypothetical protein